MHYLYFADKDTKQQRILYVEGDTQYAVFHFNNDESIYEVHQIVDDEKKLIKTEIIKEVGKVQLDGYYDVEFIFTDPDFKNSINYDEETGQSSLDGSAWQVLPDSNQIMPAYLNIDNSIQMYISTKIPCQSINYGLNPLEMKSLDLDEACDITLAEQETTARSFRR